MKRYIRAAQFLSKFGELLKSISDGFFRCIQKMFDYSLDFEDFKKNDDGSSVMTIKLKNTKVTLTVTITPVEGKKDVIDIFIKGSDGKTKEIKNVKSISCDDLIVDAIKQVWKVDVTEDTSDADIAESRKMSVTLQRVCGSTEDTIHLLGIYGNYNPAQMMQDLDTILASEAFVEQLTEDPTSFEICDQGEDLDVNECKCENGEFAKLALVEMLKVFVLARDELLAIHWNAKGEQFRDIHNLTGNHMWEINSHIDTLAELCVEFSGFVPHPRMFQSEALPVDTVMGYRYSDALSAVKATLESLIHVLECYRSNFPEDVQRQFNDWIRSYKVESRYAIAQTLS